MKRLIILFMLIVAGCGGDDSVDPIVNMYPFLIQSTPCKGSILMPAENVAIQQGDTKGPFDSWEMRDACFLVTTTGASTISITTSPASNADILFRSPDLKIYNSNYEVNPSTSVPVALQAAEVQVSGVAQFNFTITVN